MMIRDRTLGWWGSLFCLLLAISLLPPGLATASDQSILLDRMVQEIHDKQKNVGLSAAVIRGEQIVYTKQLGQADLENQVAVIPETRFGIASVTKAFTAVVLLQLVAEGKISLAAPVQNYVREFPEKPKGPITVSDLARHQSGIPHPQNRTPEFYATHYESAVEAMKVFADEELLFEPGSVRPRRILPVLGPPCSRRDYCRQRSTRFLSRRTGLVSVMTRGAYKSIFRAGIQVCKQAC